MPAIDLTGTGIDLHSGDQIDAHVTYDGTTLNLTLTDILTLATRSFLLPVNIPAIVGGTPPTLDLPEVLAVALQVRRSRLGHSFLVRRQYLITRMA